MIFDSLDNASLYEGIHPDFPAAFDFLRRAMQNPPSVGRHEIKGSDIYANVMTCTTGPEEERTWEAHKNYIDIQFIVRGEEVIGCTDVSRMVSPSAYDEEHDIIQAPRAKHRGSCDLVDGCFGIFFPQDAHQPNCMAGEPSDNFKIVVKVRVK